MTDDNIAVLALIQKTDGGDFLKSVAEAALLIMDYETMRPGPIAPKAP